MPLAIEHKEKSARIFEDLSKARPAEPRYRRNWAQALRGEAQAMEILGRYHDAIRIIRQALPIFEGLVSAYPADTFCQKLLKDALTGLGVAQYHAGVPAHELLETGKQELAISERFVALHPERPDLHLTLGVTLINLHYYYARFGRLREALAAIERARDVLERSAKTFPKETAHQIRLANVYQLIGSQLDAIGQTAESLAVRKRALALCNQLVDADPTNTDFLSELAQSHSGIGDHLAIAGKPALALEHMEQGRAIRQRLVDANPTLVLLRSNLAWSFNAIGNLLLDSGKPAEALAAHENARVIRQKLVDAEPRVPGYQRHLGMSFNNIGDSLARMNRPEQAIAAYSRARDIHEALVKGDPATHDYQTGLAFSLTGLSRTYAEVGRPVEAVASARRAITLREGLPSISIESRFDLARNHALLAALARDPRSGLSAAQGTVEADCAITALWKAVAAGYRKLDQLQTDRDLDLLRSGADFQMLVLDVAFPADPFARIR